MKSKQVKNIPELRFPEFLDDGEWEEKELIDISDFINEKIALNKLTLNNYISTENLLQDFSGVAISSKLPDVKTVTHFKGNDILISNIRPYLKKVWSATFDGGASNDVIVVRAKENTNNNFLTYLLKNEEFINYVMQGAKGVKMPRGDISLIKKYPLHISPKPKEQQKIADCLSSIDNLITASTKKCETLKLHKKALMQQLFPTDGEEVPKLRFPEFENDGEWEEKTLNELLTIGNGKDYKHLSSGEVPVYGTGGYMLSVNDYLYDGESVCIGRKGTIDKPMFLTGKFWTVDTLFYTHSFKNCIPKYIFYYFGTINWYNYNEAGGVPSLSKATINKINIPIPPKDDMNEQQKIADCLSSIDELITAQSKKVEILKEYKKGLMQQLFPSKEVDE